MSKAIIILLLLFTSSFSKTIITVTYPVEEFFIKKISGKKLHIRTIYDGFSKFDLTKKRSVEKFLSADYYFTFGLEKEKKLAQFFKAKNENLKAIDMTKGIRSLNLENGDKNPYIWMDPILVRKLAKNIYENLIKIRHYNRHEFKENYEKFLLELDKIYLELKKRVDNSEVYGFFTFNNQFDYFAKRFRLDLYRKENRRLFIQEVPEIIKFSRRENISHIVIAKYSDYSIAQSLASNINGKIVEVDIFDKNWKINLYAFVRGITNF